MSADVQQISQESICGYDQVVSLVKGHELRIDRKRKHKQSRYRVNTLVLDNKPRWHLKFPWGTLLIAVLLVIAVLPGSLIQFSPTQQISWAIYASVTVLLLLCLYRIWSRTAIVRTFHTLHARYGLLELARNKPSKDEFVYFVEHLQENIKSYQDKHKLPEDKQLAGEMRTLRRLRNEKIISKVDYENAKEKLFKLF